MGLINSNVVGGSSAIKDISAAVGSAAVIPVLLGVVAATPALLHAAAGAIESLMSAQLTVIPQAMANVGAAVTSHSLTGDQVVVLLADVANLAGARPQEIVFTSGATESDNLAVKGVAWMYREKGDHIITCVTEHKAILDTCKHLEKLGAEVTYLPVQADGLIDLSLLEAAMRPTTVLVSIIVGF